MCCGLSSAKFEGVTTAAAASSCGLPQAVACDSKASTLQWLLREQQDVEGRHLKHMRGPAVDLKHCKTTKATLCAMLLQVQQAVEALDPEHLCREYWAGKAAREAVAAGLPLPEKPAQVAAALQAVRSGSSRPPRKTKRAPQ